MEELLQNETAFDIFFNSLERVRNLKNFQEDLRNGNEQLACKKHFSEWIGYFGLKGFTCR